MKPEELNQYLFKPFQHPLLSLENRIVMAPMTRRFSPNGVPTDQVADYYQRRAAGGVGLIITEGTTVDHNVASMDPNIPCFHGQAALAGWAKVVDKVHQAGAKIMPQLWHVGAARKPGVGPNPELEGVSPSGILARNTSPSHAMSLAEIDHLIQAFIDSAKAAQEIGFDGVELHGAHGYLIDQFFWQGTNQRTDHYGGSLAKRNQFALEIIRGIRQAVGPDFPLVLRYSQWKLQDYDARLAQNPDELAQFLQPLSEAGVDIFHVSTRRFWQPAFDHNPLTLSGWTREITGKPTILVGSVGLDTDFIASFAEDSLAKTSSFDELLACFAEQQCDLVAVGRALLSNPDWPQFMQRGDYDALQPYQADVLSQLV